MRKILVVAFSLVVGIALWNYFSLQKHVSEIIEADRRNEGINALVHFEWFVNPNVIVFDIRDVSSDKSPMDVSRVLLQLSEKLKNDSYQNVILSFKGNYRFMLKGNFFKETGMEYEIQNPVYTLRNLPQNIYNLDGTKAFPTWTGGLIGVLGKQMEDLAEFHKQWYINGLAFGS